jgi:hypothetical protein
MPIATIAQKAKIKTNSQMKKKLNKKNDNSQISPPPFFLQEG